MILYRIGRPLLIVLTLLSAAAACYIAVHRGNLMGGWGGPNFWDGCARICFSFLAGLLIYRSNWIIKNNLGFAGIGILLFLSFIMPFNSWSWLTEPLVVLFYFPLLIALGAGAKLSSGLKKICNFSGKISYPLYMTHYVAIWMFLNYYNTHKPGTTQLALIISIGTALLVGLSWLVMVIYDIPVRKYLGSKRKIV